MAKTLTRRYQQISTNFNKDTKAGDIGDSGDIGDIGDMRSRALYRDNSYKSEHNLLPSTPYMQSR